VINGFEYKVSQRGCRLGDQKVQSLAYVQTTPSPVVTLGWWTWSRKTENETNELNKYTSAKSILFRVGTQELFAYESMTVWMYNVPSYDYIIIIIIIIIDRRRTWSIARLVLDIQVIYYQNRPSNRADVDNLSWSVYMHFIRV